MLSVHSVQILRHVLWYSTKSARAVEPKARERDTVRLLSENNKYARWLCHLVGLALCSYTSRGVGGKQWWRELKERTRNEVVFLKTTTPLKGGQQVCHNYW
jgi:hypothetical protein